MRRVVLISLLAVLCCAVGTGSSPGATVMHFDDIQFWVGEGPQRSAFTLDWGGTAQDSTSLTWGFRWSGNATGGEMLLAILAADDRLYAKTSPQGPMGVALYGLGYDFDGDGQFALDDQTQFDAFGIAISAPADGAAAIDPDDLYLEGWFLGFWNYAFASDSPFNGTSQWQTPSSGMAMRILTDGAWDSWTYTAEFDFQTYPTATLAAPVDRIRGDYNGDGQVNAADFTRWRDHLSTAVDVPGEGSDGDRNGVIDLGDYDYWKSHFEGTDPASGTIAPPRTIPEPSSRPIFALTVVYLVIVYCAPRSYLIQRT